MKQETENQIESAKAVETHGRKNIVWGTLLGYLGLALSVVSGLLYTPWIISQIGSSSYGLYILCNALISLFLLDFGLGMTINAFLAKYKAAGDTAKIQHFLGLVTKLYLIIDLVILIAFVTVYFLIDNIYVGLSQVERDSFKNVFLIAASFSIIAFPCSVIDGVISSYEEFVAIKIIDVSVKVLYIAFTALAISLGWGLIGLISVNSLTNLLGIIARFCIMHFKLKVRADFKSRPENCEIKTILFYSAWAAVVAISARLVFNVTPSILGIMSDSSNIATFGIVASLESYVYMFGAVMSGFFLPKISRINNSAKDNTERNAKINALALKVGRVQIFILLLVEVGFICCGKEFLELWLRNSDKGINLNDAYIGTLIIILYQLIFVPQLVYYTAMYANGYVKHLAVATLTKAVVNVSLSFLFSHFFGALGACIAIACGRVFELVIENYFYAKKLGANLPNFFLGVYPKNLIPALIALGIGLTLHFVLPVSAIYRFLIIGCSVVVIYLSLAPFCCFSKEEREKIVSSIKRKLHLTKTNNC